MTTALITREYNGNVFHFREDGYFNMTKAAKAFGKEVKEFLRLPATVEYVAALEKVGISHVYEARQGRNGGTWGHPKLAVFYARWLDVKFAVFCDMVIDDSHHLAKLGDGEILKVNRILLGETRGGRLTK